MNVHEQYAELPKLLADGYIEVGRVHYEHDGERFDRLNLGHPDYDCLQRMRPWRVYAWGTKDVREEQHGFCMMDKGHKGRHSTITFSCDVCGKTRRGEPSYRDDSVSACFMCRRGVI